MEKRHNIPFARTLRKASTDAEARLWQALRARQLANCKFRRQVPMGRYIVDFACLEAWLVVEVDGGQHGEREEHDETRTRFLESRGFRVLRFWNTDVLQKLDGVLERVLMVLQVDHPHPSPLPPAGGGAEAAAPSRIQQRNIGS